jgi:hypothetical protein
MYFSKKVLNCSLFTLFSGLLADTIISHRTFENADVLFDDGVAVLSKRSRCLL